MPDSASQHIADLLLQHDIDLLRVLDSTESEIEQQVHRITVQLVAVLAASDPTEPVRQAYQKQRMAVVLDQARTITRDEYRSIYRQVRKGLLALAREEVLAFREIVNQGLGADVMAGELSPTQIGTIIDERVITANVNDAETMRGFFEREAAAHHKRVQGTLQQGFSQGDTLSQLTTRLREMEGLHTREATAIARSAYNHVENWVRIEMMQRNSALFRGVICIAILDGNTTPVCISRSNAQWDLNTGRPLPGSPVQTRFPGPPPWHMSCRSKIYPLTKTAQQVGRASERARRALEQLTPEQRALLNADPPAQESYPEWLRRQPEAVQVKVLGRQRRQWWLEGKLNLRELTTQKGRPLTIKELRQRNRIPVA